MRKTRPSAPSRRAKGAFMYEHNEPDADRLDTLEHDAGLSRRAKAIAWATVAIVGGVAAGAGFYVTSAKSPSSSGSAPVAAALAAATAPASPGASPGVSGAPPSPAPGHGFDKRGPRGLGWPGFRLGPGGPGGWGGGLTGKVLHSEATVATPSGGTEIVDTQIGTIASVNTTAKTVTVTSTDKVSFTYVVDANTKVLDFAASKPAAATLADLKVGDTVRLAAIRSGDTRTATSLIDGQPPRGGHRGFAGPNAPQPSASTSAGGTSA